MNEFDKNRFKQAMNNASMMMQRPMLDKAQLLAFFGEYEAYPIEVMEMAIKAASRDSASSFHGITAALLDKHLGIKSPADLTVTDIIAMGRDKKCPLGVLISLAIGAKDLKERDTMELTVPAKQFLSSLPDSLSKLNSGDLSDHEIAIMHKYNVDPLSAPMPGLPAPHAYQEIQQRIAIAQGTDVYKAHNDEQQWADNLIENLDGQARIAQEMMKIEAPKPQSHADNTAEQKAKFDADMTKLMSRENDSVDQQSAEDAEYTRLMKG